MEEDESMKVKKYIFEISDNLVEISESDYHYMNNRVDLLSEVLKKINSGASPESVVDYIKLQHAAWVADKL